MRLVSKRNIAAQNVASYSAGATRTALRLDVSSLPKDEEGFSLRGRFMLQGEYEHKAFISSQAKRAATPVNDEPNLTVKFINENKRKTLKISPEAGSEEVGYLFFEKGYDFTLVKGEALVWEKSTSACEGGVMALVKEGAIVKSHSYKDRSAATYYVAKEGKWVEYCCLPPELAEGQAQTF